MAKKQNRAIELLMLVADILCLDKDEENKIETEELNLGEFKDKIGKRQPVAEYKESPLSFRGWLR